MKATHTKIETLKKEIARIEEKLKRETVPVKKEMARELLTVKIKETLKMEESIQVSEQKIKEKKSLIEETTKERKENITKLERTVMEEKKRECAAFSVRPSRKYCIRYDKDKKCLEWKGVYRKESCLIYDGDKCVKSEYNYDRSNSKYQCVSKEEKLSQEVCEEFKEDGECKTKKTIFGVKECVQHKVDGGKIVCGEHRVFFPMFSCLEYFDKSKKVCRKRKFFQPKFFCQIYNEKDGSRYCSTLKQYYSEDQVKIECTKDDDKLGCMRYEMTNVRERTTEIVRESSITNIIKTEQDQKKTIVDATKEVEEAKKKVRELVDRIKDVKDRKIVKEVEV